MPTPMPVPPAPTPAKPAAPKRRRHREGPIRAALFFCAALSVITTAAIIVTLVTESGRFFQHVSVWEFLTGTEWTPLFRPQKFGVLPLVSATLLTSLGAMLVALPVGLGSAIYLSEYAPARLRRVLKPILEILAGVPTVVYGYFALNTVTPALRHVFPKTELFNTLSPALVMGVMIIPMVASLSEDAMLAVPRSLREGAYALGSTRLEVATKVVVPAALSGIIAAFILAVSRAIGETMIVTLAGGSTPRLSANPLIGMQTMTAYIVQVSLGDTPAGSVEYQTLFVVGLLLFLMTLAMSTGSRWIRRRYWRAAA